MASGGLYSSIYSYSLELLSVFVQYGIFHKEQFDLANLEL